MACTKAGDKEQQAPPHLQQLLVQLDQQRQRRVVAVHKLQCMQLAPEPDGSAGSSVCSVTCFEYSQPAGIGASALSFN